MVVQNPFDMGVQTVRLLKAMIEDDKATIKEMFPNAGQAGRRHLHDRPARGRARRKSPVKAELFDPKVVEFMLLPDFKAWLDKYGLTVHERPSPVAAVGSLVAAAVNELALVVAIVAGVRG